MRSSSTAGFIKHRACPRAEALAAYVAGASATAAGRARISAHVAACDFCGAETQLLSRFPPPTNALPFVAFPLPEGLRRLALDVLAEPSQSRARFADSILEIERLTLTDA